MELKELIQIIGIIIPTIGVVIACISIYVELRKTNNHFQRQNLNEFTKRYSDIIYNIPEKLLIEDLSSIDLKKEEPEEYYKVLREMRRYFDMCFDEYHLGKNKHISDETFSIWKGGMKKAMTRKIFKESWIVLKEDSEYGKEFEVFIDTL